MNILKYKNILISVSLAMMVIAMALVTYFGFNPSIDFQGGSLYEIHFTEARPSIETLEATVSTVLPTAIVQHSGEEGVLIKNTSISEEEKNTLSSKLAEHGALEEVRFKELGPAFSQELVNKSLFAILLVIVIIVGFIAYTFREVSGSIDSWKYGVIAIIALIHDTLIPVGVFALLGSLFIKFQIDVLFVTAILATLGYSVNDTIVVFDRVRENLRLRAQASKEIIRGKAFEEVVEKSLQESMRRSLFTSLTTLTALLILFFVGSEATRPFALVLAIGVVVGTYSSLFLASPLLLYAERLSSKKSQKEPASQDSSEEDDKLPDDIQRFLNKQRNKTK